MFNWPKFIFPGGLPCTNKSNTSKFKHWMELQTPAGLTIPANSVADPSSAGVTGARQVNHTTSTTKRHSADLLCTCPRCLHLTTLSLLLWAWEKFWSCHSYIFCPSDPYHHLIHPGIFSKHEERHFNRLTQWLQAKSTRIFTYFIHQFEGVAWVCPYFLYINKETLNITGLMMSFSYAHSTNPHLNCSCKSSSHSCARQRKNQPGPDS